MSLFRANPRPPALKPDDLIEVAGLPVRLRVNARARRISLRIDTHQREAVATAPSPRRLAEAVAFAESRAGWIAAHLEAVPDTTLLRPGLTLDVGGRPCRLERAATRIAPRLIPATTDEPQRLLASGDGETYGRAAVRALRAEASKRLLARTEAHARALGQPMPGVAITDARRRWGSCRQARRGAPAAIRYSWRLILTPEFVLDYVAAHEAAHLIEGNHGPKFWAVVEQLYGDPRPARTWLRTHGGKLHAIGA